MCNVIVGTVFDFGVDVAAAVAVVVVVVAVADFHFHFHFHLHFAAVVKWGRYSDPTVAIAAVVVAVVEIQSLADRDI